MQVLMMQPNLKNLETLQGVRAEALMRWQEHGWPGVKDESWKFTRLTSLNKQELRIAESGIVKEYKKNQASDLFVGAHEICFHNGALVDTSLKGLPDGVTVHALDEKELRDILVLAPQEHPITDLSLAAMTYGLCMEIAPAAKILKPIIFVFTGEGNSLSAHPVILLRIGAAAQAVVSELHRTYVGLNAPLIGIDIADDGRLDYVKIQADGIDTTHLALTGINMGRGSIFDGFQLSKGGILARLEVHITLAAESADCRLSGIYLGENNQHHDITTNMKHSSGFCNSNQVIRGVLDNSARGVFQGKVHVAQDAQKTDGQQMSRALLLSRKAEANSKPELEIFADDVICAHGATVGELDESQLFYLISRGISPDVARGILIEAFLNDAVDMVENSQLSSFLRPFVNEWMHNRKGALND